MSIGEAKAVCCQHGYRQIIQLTRSFGIGIFGYGAQWQVSTRRQLAAHPSDVWGTENSIAAAMSRGSSFGSLFCISE